MEYLCAKSRECARRPNYRKPPAIFPIGVLLQEHVLELHSLQLVSTCLYVKINDLCWLIFSSHIREKEKGNRPNEASHENSL